MKALTVRVPEDLDEKFSEFCRQKGYKKGGFILSMLGHILNAHTKINAMRSMPSSTFRGNRDPLEGIEKFVGKNI